MPGEVLLGEDTRESSPTVTGYLAGGLRRAGAKPVSAGVLPTPAVAHLVRAQDFLAGVVVSASHNPYRDNGIKLIAATGTKFPDETETLLEEFIERFRAEGGAPQAEAPSPRLELADAYLEWLQKKAGVNLTGLRLVVDCANGAAVRTAPKLLRALGADVVEIHSAPDGKNINEGCGALHPESLRQKVLEVHAAVGVAFDGDADRAIFASGSGKVVNGDGILLAAARRMMKKGTLKGGAVVGTVMANLGLELALKKEGLALVRTPVGDRYVLEEMQRRKANLGGEQSGHIIFLDDAPTGDGLLTALHVFALVKEERKSLDELTADLKVFPQVLRNVRVREKRPLEELPAVAQAIREAEAAMGERGRVVVRYSGTEPLLRVMVEAETEAEVERWTDHICRAIESVLG
jgi:phosphoglucosamine mutase